MLFRSCQTVKGACTLVGITWDQAWHVLERAVARGLARKQATAIARIGVDEKAFRKGHRYLTIVNDVDRGTVEFVAEGRDKASLAAFYESRTPEQLAGIEAVALDMWEPYIQSTLEAVPLASSKIVFDRFHVMQHITEAVDVVRRRENRLLITEDDDRLKGTKYLWISSKEEEGENLHGVREPDVLLLDRIDGLGDRLQARDVAYASQLGYVVKLVAVAERQGDEALQDPVPLDVRVHPTLLPRQHPLAGVHGVNNAILVEGDRVGQVMFYGPGAGAGPTASAVVADILNIAGIREVAGAAGPLDPLLAASRWRRCRLVDPGLTQHRNYLRLRTTDQPGVIGKIGSCFGDEGVSIRSIVQFETSTEGADAEIVVITHEVEEARFRQALAAIEALEEVRSIAACLRTL